jgi:hypothetical protein
VDHVKDYKAPKMKEGETRKEEGCAPRTPSPITTVSQETKEDRKARKKAKKKLKKEEKARSKLGLKANKTTRRESDPVSLSERAKLLEEKYGSARRSSSPEIRDREARKRDDSPPQRAAQRSNSPEMKYRGAKKRDYSPPRGAAWRSDSPKIRVRETKKIDYSPPQREKLGKRSEDERRERKRTRTSSQERYREIRSSDKVKGHKN